jgi:hypothetical protein
VGKIKAGKIQHFSPDAALIRRNRLRAQDENATEIV